MPELNKTGPTGQGPKTGRKMGRCDTENETIEKPRFGRRFGRGRGMRNRFGLSDNTDKGEKRGIRFGRRNQE